ncbi:MAG: putative AlkP superfamily phosphohydrolase/phosphomutase/tetratricopeptide (TPR) repeat protein [Akkermansiaceae bacterium]
MFLGAIAKDRRQNYLPLFLGVTDSKTNSLRLAKRVLLIGWDAADWQLIDRYLAEGKMPYMQQFLDRGSRGNLATLKPVLSPMLWNSIATGKRPYKHGILGFTEPMPDGQGVRPSTSTTRRCKALWNILTQQGMTSNVVSWFVSHPAEPINGVCVSDTFQKIPLNKDNPQSPELPPLAEGAVHPPELADELAALRMHPAELTEEVILSFIPKAAKIDQAKDQRLTTFAKLFAEMASVHNAATRLIEKNDWDFMGVYYDSIDHFGHGFMEYHPPKMDHISEEDFKIYHEVMEACYRFHDLILGRLLALAGEDTTVILCSDHGYLNDHLRPPETPSEPAGPAVWHRDQGVIAMAGPGVRKGEQITGANLLDIAPTILNLLGLPAGKDMDGKSLTHIIGGEGWTPPWPIESWEEVEGEAGMHSKDAQEDPFAAREALRQLVELGYIEEPDPDAEKAARNAAREAQFNLARAYQDGRMMAEATEILEDLWDDHGESRFGLALANAYLRQGQFEKVRPLAEEILSRIEEAQNQQAEQLETQVRRIDEEPEAIISGVHERWEKMRTKAVQHEEEEALKAGRKVREIEPKPSPVDAKFLAARRKQMSAIAEGLRSHHVRAAPNVKLLLGHVEALDGHFEAALAHLREAEKAEPRLPGLHLQLGQIYLRMRRAKDAARAFRRALEIDPDNPQAHEGLATALTRLKRYDEAVDHALSAVELLHALPSAHLRLGATLARLELWEKAVQAFETTLKLAPGTTAAHRYLVYLYRAKLNRPDLAFEHGKALNLLQRKIQPIDPVPIKSQAPSNPKTPDRPTALSQATASQAPAKEVITIVAGLPRSGTSMMMQMLAAGGLEIHSDGKRAADESNPKGYYECEKARQLATDRAWLVETRGQVIKIVAQLLPYLPSEINGEKMHDRVIWTERNLDEVIRSQTAMLVNDGRSEASLSPAELASVYEKQLGKVWTALTEKGIPVCQIQHGETIKDPETIARVLAQFLGDRLETKRPDHQT